jgi:hypothetical protein
MSTFIEKNKKWLKFYSTASKILGWVLILLASIKVLYLLTMSFGMIRERQLLLVSLGAIVENTFGQLPVGIILLGVGQLLRYTYEDEYKVPWLLRNGAKMLYLFAILAILRPFVFYLFQHGMNASSHFTFGPLSLADVLILIGLGNILKRVLPIIEEYRSLI